MQEESSVKDCYYTQYSNDQILSTPFLHKLFKGCLPVTEQKLAYVLHDSFEGNHSTKNLPK